MTDFLTLFQRATLLRQRLSSASFGNRNDTSSNEAGPSVQQASNAPLSSPTNTPIQPPLPTTPSRKRKADYGQVASPSTDLMALTLDSPSRLRFMSSHHNTPGRSTPRRSDGHERNIEANGPTTPSKKRMLGGKGTPSGSPARIISTGNGPGGPRSSRELTAAVMLSPVSQLGRRASLGSGPRLGFALPHKQRTHGTVAGGSGGGGVEGYVTSRYGDLMHGSRYPPPLSPSRDLLARESMTNGHRRRISSSGPFPPAVSPSIASSPARKGSTSRAPERTRSGPLSASPFISSTMGKKPRSSSHSIVQSKRPLVSWTERHHQQHQQSGEEEAAASVLTEMLGGVGPSGAAIGSPLRRTAGERGPRSMSPLRSSASSQTLDRDEDGFRIPPNRQSNERNEGPNKYSGDIKTPPHQISKLPGHDTTPTQAATKQRRVTGSRMEKESSDEDQRAAELMIFLAQSPGSAQHRG